MTADPSGVELADYTAAIAYLRSAGIREHADHRIPEAQRLLARAEFHLNAKIRRYFSDGPIFDSEKAFAALLKDVGHQLTQAGQELGLAAEALKFAGKGKEASRAKQASNQALEAAQGVVPA